MIHIVLAEDHLLIRHQLKRLLAQESDWRVAAEAGDGLEALRLVEELNPDVLVTDLAMPGLHGLEVARSMHCRSCRTKIVVVSVQADEAYVRQAFRNGVLGYLRKDELGRHLVPAIRSALLGERYLGPSIAGWVPKPATVTRGRARN